MRTTPFSNKSPIRQPSNSAIGDIKSIGAAGGFSKKLIVMPNNT